MKKNKTRGLTGKEGRPDNSPENPLSMRPTLGILSHGFSGDPMWTGAAQFARQRDVNLIGFAGGILGSHAGFEAQGNVLFDLVNAQNVAGLIIAGILGHSIGAKKLYEFCQRYHNIPMVSLEVPLPGIPCVSLDFYQGMREVVTHLLEVHGYRRIAFIRSPEESVTGEDRYRAYTDSLDEYDIPFDPNLVAPGTFFAPSGAEAVHLLLDTRKLHIEAIVAANDYMALDAMQALQTRGIRVPEDIAVVGFDEQKETGVVTPPLTTAQLREHELGQRAVELLLDVLEGKEVPEEVILPTKLVVRQSCGCPSFAMEQAAVRTITADNEPIEIACTDHLFDRFMAEIRNGTPGIFVATLKELLRQAGTNGRSITTWNHVISDLRRQALASLESVELLTRAEDLLHQARILIGEGAEREQAYQSMQVEQDFIALRGIGQALITTFDVPELMDILAQELPRIGIPACYLALYENDAESAKEAARFPSEWSNLVLAYNEHGRIQIEPEGRRFFSSRLVPDDMLSDDKRRTMIVEALYFREKQLGFFIFEEGVENIVTRTAHLVGTPGENPLRGEISSALQGAILVQQIQAHSEEILQYRDHLEELVKKRTAELARSNARLHDEIIERRRVEQALRVSEQQYRLLAENVMDGLVIVQNDKLILANKVFADMTGYPPEHFDMADSINIFHALDKDAMQARLERETGTRFPVSQWHTELITKDGCTLWVEIKQTRIVWDGQPALLLTIRDITDRKIRERRLEEERARLEEENLSLKSSIRERYRFGPLVGKSPAMQRVYELLASAAPSDVNVLISGESGTGKELIARTIHQVGRRKSQPFVPVNCASIPDTLFEREFFGHHKGAFTGADRNKPGLFDRAHQGILFLDEVTELSPGAQAKLLRVLQDGEYTPLGSNNPKKADVLIVAATNKEYQQEIKQDRLRKDFFYRICVVVIDVPPLRERKDDLPLLIEYFLEQYHQKHTQVHGNVSQNLPFDQTMLPAELVKSLYTYDWPGNIRELQNILQRYLVTGNLQAVLPSLGGSPRSFSHSTTESGIFSEQFNLPELIRSLEKQHIQAALTQTGGHIVKAAKILGFPRSSLYRKIKQYQLD